MRLADPAQPFPNSLLAGTTPALEENPKWAASDRENVERHNGAVTDFRAGRNPSKWRRPEITILSLAKSVEQWTRTDNGQDGYGTPKGSWWRTPRVTTTTTIRTSPTITRRTRPKPAGDGSTRRWPMPDDYCVWCGNEMDLDDSIEGIFCSDECADLYEEETR